MSRMLMLVSAVFLLGSATAGAQGPTRAEVESSMGLPSDGDLVRGTGRWYVFTADGRPAIAVGNLTFDDAGAPTNSRHTIDVCDALS